MKFRWLPIVSLHKAVLNELEVIYFMFRTTFSLKKILEDFWLHVIFRKSESKGLVQAQAGQRRYRHQHHAGQQGQTLSPVALLLIPAWPWR